MNNKLTFGLRDAFLFIIGLIPLAVAVLYYSELPGQIAIHFDLSGEANGYIQKKYALWLIGFISLGIPILLKITRNIDPKRANYLKFEGAFEQMRLFVCILINGLMLFTIFYNLGYTLGIKHWGIPATGIFFIFMGNVLSRIRFNYFIGIRTPWTLSNEEVWRRTHRFAGPIFMIAGVLMVLSFLFTNPAWIIIAALLILVIVPTGYSYVISRRLNQHLNNRDK